MDIKWRKDNRPELSKETMTINGQVFQVVMEKDEVGHEVPWFQQNRIVRAFLDAAQKGRKLDLNEIWERAMAGAYCKEEMLEFYRLIGYPLSGYAEIFSPEKLESSVWCDKCGCYPYIHPRPDCPKFVKEAKL